MKRVIEMYVYRHNQAPGIVVRRIKREGGEKIADVSQYFSFRKYGGKREAVRVAIRWKQRNLSGSFWR